MFCQQTMGFSNLSGFQKKRFLTRQPHVLLLVPRLPVARAPAVGPHRPAELVAGRRGERRVRGRVVVAAEAEMRGRGRGRAVPRPPRRGGRLPVEHPQLVVHGVGRRRAQVVGRLLLGRGQVSQDTVDG